MTHRISVSLPDDIYGDVQRVARASRVSEASVIRSALADLMPRITRTLDFIGSEPHVTPAEVETNDAWFRALREFLATAPLLTREALGDLDELFRDDQP